MILGRAKAIKSMRALALKRSQKRTMRNLRIGPKRLAEMETGVGFSSTGPGTQIGNIWSDHRIGAPQAAAEGLERMSLGLTANGRLAAAKALHPACDVGPQRWPDKAANESLVFQKTDAFVVKYMGDKTDPTATWNCQMWLTNLIDAPLFTATREGPEAPHNPNKEMNTHVLSEGQQKDSPYSVFYSKPWTANGQPGTKHPSTDYQQIRVTARSITVDLVSNATSNQGIVYAAQFSPNMANLPFAGSEVTVESVMDMIERVVAQKLLGFSEKKDKEVMSLTSDDDVDDLVDVFNTVRLNDDDPDPPTSKQTGQRVVFEDWPVTSQEIIQMSPGSYMAKADRGVYMVLKHSADTLQYCPTLNEAWLSAIVPHAQDDLTTECNVLLGNGWNMGAIAFEGLSVSALLSVKVITCYEATVRSDSILSPYVEEAPPLDKLAQDHTRAAMGRLPDAFPAADNVLGGIVKWIADALSASGIPILSQGASLARMVNRATGERATKWLDNNVF